MKEKITDEDLKTSPKMFINEKKNLENLKIDLLKNFYLLTDMLLENNFDEKRILDNLLVDILSKMNIMNPNDDVNLLLIVNIYKL